MKSVLRVMFPAAIAGLLVAASAGPLEARGHGAGGHGPSRTFDRTFDGIWSVSIVTAQGDCGHSYRYPLRIWYGRVVKADDDQNFQVSGMVAHGGRIAVTVSGLGQTASGTGRLSHDNGEGVWHSVNGQCSGNWTASRRS